MVRNYDRTDVMSCCEKVVNRLDSCKYYILSAVVCGMRYRSGYNHHIRRLSWSSEEAEPAFLCEKTIAPDDSWDPVDPVADLWAY